jgi:hypothetical protein
MKNITVFSMTVGTTFLTQQGNENLQTIKMFLEKDGIFHHF